MNPPTYAAVIDPDHIDPGEPTSSVERWQAEEAAQDMARMCQGADDAYAAIASHAITELYGKLGRRNAYLLRKHTRAADDAMHRRITAQILRHQDILERMGRAATPPF